VVLDVTEERFAPELEAAAYFIVAEALTNAAKHAHARAVEVSVAPVGDELRISVVDDGVGGADAARGSGLRGLEDRVAVLAGRFSVGAAAGGGTALRATLPLGGSA
jgi:signal transduction histidine kinase